LEHFTAQPAQVKKFHGIVYLLFALLRAAEWALLFGLLTFLTQEGFKRVQLHEATPSSLDHLTRRSEPFKGVFGD
jgi:hypothetical protein